MLGHKKRPVPGLVPGTHAFLRNRYCGFKAWMAGTSPAMGDVGFAVALVER